MDQHGVSVLDEQEPGFLRQAGHSESFNSSSYLENRSRRRESRMESYGTFREGSVMVDRLCRGPFSCRFHCYGNSHSPSLRLPPPSSSGAIQSDGRSRIGIWRAFG